MEFTIRNVQFSATECDVTKAIAEVLHACPGPFVSDDEVDQRRINFEVKLKMNDYGGVRNSGFGSLRVPSRDVGLKFRRLIDGEDGVTIKVGGKRLKFIPTSKHIPPNILATLQKAPYVDPDIAQKRQQTIDALSTGFRIDKLQIGTFYRTPNALPTDPRAFSVEWECDLVHSGLGWLRFEYEHKLIRAKVGDPDRGELLYSLIIKFANIHKMALDYDFGNPYICFDLFAPPIIEAEDVNRTLNGDWTDSKNFRDRVGALHLGHERVAPYAHHIRITLYKPEDPVETFKAFCKIAGLHPPVTGVRIEATRQGFFTSKKLSWVRAWLRSLSSNWPVAFQIEALLRNGVANTAELEDLRPRIDELIRRHQPFAAHIMRFFVIKAAGRPSGQTIQKCFELVLQNRLGSVQAKAPAGRFYCHHVTVTPTRLILEGPNIMQSNRVIREYEGYEDNFIRVDFRDEDRLQYRWDREVDGASFVRHRVGGFLRDGFELAGRHFTFLAYSQSALREHAVWFVSSFQNATGLVNAHTIRESLGDFSGCITSPSKYAARMAQAFTATDPSVRIHRSQWSEVPDIVENNIMFSDGVGSISEDLGDAIWKALCDAQRNGGVNTVKPSAYQIRFLGFKGVVSVDKQLEGTHLRLRESMNKFRDNGVEIAWIEIARAIVKPNTPHLNRPLVMVLEDRGASKDTFLDLQRKVVAEARTANESVDTFAGLLESHGMCGPFKLASMLRKLHALGMELKPSHLQRNIDTPFLTQVRACAINHVLRAVKHEARIPIPDSYMLMGVTDEGPAYEKRGYQDVFKLPPGKIYACVQKPGEDEVWLHGPCLVSRSPVIHPGDVQQAYAIGKPPADKLCLFAHLKNVVVFSSTGTTCLPNSLGGGDLDGDLYEVIQHPPLILPDHYDPASYPSRQPFKIDRPSTIDDVCNFVVEYINSDVVGLVSDKHIVIADQANDGTFDKACLKLAELHSQAVDYPKNGWKVNIDDLPRNLIPYKPDWHAAEVESPRPTDYYESDRALGHLYRNIELDDIPPYIPQRLENDQISITLRPLVKRQLERRQRPSKLTATVDSIYSAYLDELTYIATCYTLSRVPGARLREEEIVVGTILGKCSQPKWRKDRTFAMIECTVILVGDIRRRMLPESMEHASPDDLRDGLEKGWLAWALSHEKSGDFGAQSFGLIALRVVLDCLEQLGELPSLSA